MTTLKKLANCLLTAVALAPLAPVIVLMWTVKQLDTSGAAAPTTETRPSEKSALEMDTVVYMSAA